MPKDVLMKLIDFKLAKTTLKESLDAAPLDPIKTRNWNFKAKQLKVYIEFEPNKYEIIILKDATFYVPPMQKMLLIKGINLFIDNFENLEGTVVPEVVNTISSSLTEMKELFSKATTSSPYPNGGDLYDYSLHILRDDLVEAELTDV